VEGVRHEAKKKSDLFFGFSWPSLPFLALGIPHAVQSSFQFHQQILCCRLTVPVEAIGELTPILPQEWNL
jgi:hypothetical protein